MATIGLEPHELHYWATKYRGPNPAASVDYAHRQAIEYVQHHATDMLPSIQNAIIRARFRYILEPDVGERKLIQRAIDAQLELGRAINANARS